MNKHAFAKPFILALWMMFAACLYSPCPVVQTAADPDQSTVTMDSAPCFSIFSEFIFSRMESLFGVFVKNAYADENDHWLPLPYYLGAWTADQSPPDVGSDIGTTQNPIYWPTPTVTPTVTPGTGSGSDAGIESKPVKGMNPSYFFRQSDQYRHHKHTVDPSPEISWWDAVSGLFVQKAYADDNAAVPSNEPPLVMADLLPDQGPEGTVARINVPENPFVVNSNAVDGVFIDFVDPESSHNLATVFCLKTVSAVYNHDYPLCNRFHNYVLQRAQPIALTGSTPGQTDPAWFWFATMTKGDRVEEAFLFNVYVNESQKHFQVDSHWLSDSYTTRNPAPYEYILNYQIWAYSSYEAGDLLLRTLNQLVETAGPDWTVSYLNSSEPVLPDLFIKSAQLRNRQALLTLQSRFTEPRQVAFTVYYRPAFNREENLSARLEATVSPGISQIALPVGAVLDAVIELELEGFKDKVYVGNGAWFDFRDGDPTQVDLNTAHCSNETDLSADDFLLPGCGSLSGRVGAQGWAGMAVTLNPNDLAIDVGEYNALTFYAQGDGQSYRISIETDAIRQQGGGDFHQFVFTAAPEGRRYTIPFSSFRQRYQSKENAVAFTGEDVISVAWSSVGAPLDSIRLSVDQVGFIKTPIITDTTLLPDTDNTQGPYTVTTRLASGTGLEQLTLYYRSAGQSAFESVPMKSMGTFFQAAIPGPGHRSRIEYYIRAVTGKGRSVVDPANAPWKGHAFFVSKEPILMGDDFQDTDPVNNLGNETGVFGEDSGGAVTVHYENGALCLQYDVAAEDSDGGYYSLMTGKDLTPYRVLRFSVKGESGGEAAGIGLRDREHNETRILISQYLAQGITTRWQEVVIPLKAFTGIKRWEAMDNFSIDFSHAMGSGAGRLHVDDVRFEGDDGLAPIRIDNFNLPEAKNGVGGDLRLWHNETAWLNISYVQDTADGDNTILQADYGDISADACGTVVFCLAGLNAAEYQYIAFRIKGGSGDEHPNIYLTSGDEPARIRAYVDIESYSYLTPDWRKIQIPLADFAANGIDLSDLKSLEIAFEWEPMDSGTIFMDDITFEKAPVSEAVSGQTDPDAHKSEDAGLGGESQGASGCFCSTLLLE